MFEVSREIPDQGVISKTSCFLSQQTQPDLFSPPAGSECMTEEREESVIITGVECVMCCVAGSDGQLHMAFPPKALLMLEAVVWAGAAGSVCQRVRGREGAEQLPPAPLRGDGKASEVCAAKRELSQSRGQL